jgi:hypothetical protein
MNELSMSIGCCRISVPTCRTITGLRTEEKENDLQSILYKTWMISPHTVSPELASGALESSWRAGCNGLPTTVQNRCWHSHSFDAVNLKPKKKPFWAGLELLQAARLMPCGGRLTGRRAGSCRREGDPRRGRSASLSESGRKAAQTQRPTAWVSGGGGWTQPEKRRAAYRRTL